jgi:hypothetical protein
MNSSVLFPTPISGQRFTCTLRRSPATENALLVRKSEYVSSDWTRGSLRPPILQSSLCPTMQRIEGWIFMNDLDFLGESEILLNL